MSGEKGKIGREMRGKVENAERRDPLRMIEEKEVGTCCTLTWKGTSIDNLQEEEINR